MAWRACGFDGYAKASAKVLRVVPEARCVAVYAFDVCKFRDDSTSRLGNIRCRDFKRLFSDFLQFVEIDEFLNVLLLFSRSGRLRTATMDQPGSERDSV